jgi:hemerythrin-like domain-containing protein
MQPEEELRADHQSIRRGIKLLEQLTGSLREGHPVRNTDLYTLVDVLGKAATNNHQAKEEEIVFAFLRDRRERFGLDGLRPFEEDHEELSEMLNEVRDLVARATGGDRRARHEIDKRAQRYGETMREHLEAEEEAFLDRLHEELSTDEIDDLDAQLSSFDGPRKARDRLEQRIERLRDSYEDRL